jgi:hypothetical protein
MRNRPTDTRLGGRVGVVCHRLGEFPNIIATQLFQELCVQFLGRYTASGIRRWPAGSVYAVRQLARAASSLGVRRIVSAAYRRGQPSAASCRYVPGDEANCSPDDMKNCTLGCGKNVGAGCCQRLLKRCRRQLPDVIRPG